MLVSNLREGCHKTFTELLITTCGREALEEIHISPEHNFGFVVFRELEVRVYAKCGSECRIHRYKRKETT